MNTPENTQANDFLKKNALDPEITKTASGLQFKIIKEGTGKTPDQNNIVTVHYIGKLVDGTVIDSSYDKGAPATFPANGVIPGWQEALVMMSEGSKWEIFIPPSLGYGERGIGPIPPNSTLIFEVELLGVK
ncbi:MAG: FKBP-type peptidyl-prolyl cis-trans isomerase [Deltaproteobacteria bacterium]|nr:FKBP-type peptidyl-prolyl cis-trans isomerase [Deltaproteobacteria bacterium]